jgi:hypothetical protein
MTDYLINVGPLTSFNSLVYYLGPQFYKIRNEYIQGKTPKFKFNFDVLKPNSISLPVLAALLANAKKLSDFIGYPVPVQMKWNPIVNAFLADTNFISIANKLRIFDFPLESLGRFPEYSLNPHTKIMYFGDVKPIDSLSGEELGIEKAKHKQKILGNLKLRCSNIFDGFDEKLENIVFNTTLELIVNSLMHAQDYAFVAMQRSFKGISVSVCDGGIGFPKSLFKSYPYDHFKSLNHAQGLFIGSLIQRDIHGLRLAIDEVIGYEQLDYEKQNVGWVNISSFDSEIRWQKSNWEKALKYMSTVDLKKNVPELKNALGEPLTGYVEREIIEQGYWRVYQNSLVGTRITFEIRF